MKKLLSDGVTIRQTGALVDFSKNGWRINRAFFKNEKEAIKYYDSFLSADEEEWYKGSIPRQGKNKRYNYN